MNAKTWIAYNMELQGFRLELLRKIREKDKSIIPDTDIRRLQKQNISFVPPLSV